MLYLSDEAIQYAIAKCRNNDRYRVCVAIPDRIRRQKLYTILHHYLGEPDDYSEKLAMNKIRIEFENGSSIDTIPASDNARGYRSHLLIVDKTIDDDIIKCVLQPHEILEEQERYINKFVNDARQKREQQEQDKKNTQQDELENLDAEYADVIESEFLEVLNGI